MHTISLEAKGLRKLCCIGGTTEGYTQLELKEKNWAKMSACRKTISQSSEETQLNNCDHYQHGPDPVVPLRASELGNTNLVPLKGAGHRDGLWCCWSTEDGRKQVTNFYRWRGKQMFTSCFFWGELWQMKYQPSAFHRISGYWLKVRNLRPLDSLTYLLCCDPWINV